LVVRRVESPTFDLTTLSDFESDVDEAVMICGELNSKAEIEICRPQCVVNVAEWVTLDVPGTLAGFTYETSNTRSINMGRSN